MLPWIYYVLLVLVLIAGWLINLLGLPGLWVMLIGHAVYAWATGWERYTGWTALIILFVLAVSAEVIEFVAGAAGSKSAGGTNRGMLGAVVGGLIGGFVGTGLIPVPVIGTIVGAVAGSFVGATVVEKLIHPDSRRALRIGYGAAKGRLLGILIKSGVGLVMAIVSLVAALPVKAAAHAPSQVTTRPSSPATSPATTLPPVPTPLPVPASQP